MILRYHGVLQYTTEMSRDDITGSSKVASIILLDKDSKTEIYLMAY
jgi:hypothetical protein